MRHRRARAALLTALVAVLGAGAWVLLGSGWFGVEQVVVRGEQRVSAAAVISAAAIPHDVPLALLDTGAAARRVEAADPHIARVEVTRVWPASVRVTVTERQPVAVTTVDGRVMLVDRFALPFAAAQGDTASLPTLTAPDLGPGSPAARAAVDVLTALPPDLATTVRTVTAGSPDSVRLGLADGATVVWGDATRGQRKAAVLAALLRVGQAGVSTYDVSAPDMATTRRDEPSPAASPVG